MHELGAGPSLEDWIPKASETESDVVQKALDPN